MVAGHSLEYIRRHPSGVIDAVCECGWVSDVCNTETRATGQWFDHAKAQEPPVELQEAKQ